MLQPRSFHPIQSPRIFRAGAKRVWALDMIRCLEICDRKSAYMRLGKYRVSGLNAIVAAKAMICKPINGNTPL